MKVYFTFGQYHAHCVNGKIFDKDCIACVEAESPTDARETMFDLFKDKWAFQYSESQVDSELLGYFSRGVLDAN